MEPVFRRVEKVSLVGTMAIYESQAEASRLIPQQWQEFRRAHAGLESGARLVGASPCTGDGKIHYLVGVELESSGSSDWGERLVLEAGEYAVVQVDDPASLRDTWGWIFGTWLPGSGRRERHAPEYERYSGISEEGLPVGMVEIWIPMEKVA